MYILIIAQITGIVKCETLYDITAHKSDACFCAERGLFENNIHKCALFAVFANGFLHLITYRILVMISGTASIIFRLLSHESQPKNESD